MKFFSHSVCKFTSYYGSFYPIRGRKARFSPVEKRRKSPLGLTDFSRYSCKFGNTQPLPPHVGGQTAVGEDICQLLLGQLLSERSIQSVDQGLSPLGKGGPHHPEEVLRVIHLSTEEVTFGAGMKQSGGTSNKSSGSV